MCNVHRLIWFNPAFTFLKFVSFQFTTFFLGLFHFLMLPYRFHSLLLHYRILNLLPFASCIAANVMGRWWFTVGRGHLYIERTKCPNAYMVFITVKGQAWDQFVCHVYCSLGFCLLVVCIFPLKSFHCVAECMLHWKSSCFCYTVNCLK